MTSPMLLPATLDQTLLAYNVFSGNLAPVDKLLNLDELYEILTSYAYHGKTYALPYLFFSDLPLHAGSKITYTHGLGSFDVEVEGFFNFDKHEIAWLMFGTSSTSHPGAKAMLNSPQYTIAGKIVRFDRECLSLPYHDKSSVNEVVFQSRNPPHRAHEEIVKRYAPNLTYSTPFATAKKSDYPFDKKIQTYEEISRRYGIDIYVTTLPRLFAGPREALQNCLLFQNKGAKKFLMGRGKNCVGDFYSETESYELCRDFYRSGKITIEPVWQETIFVGDIELKGSVIKSEYIDKRLQPPNQMMSEYISEILLSE